MAKSRREPQPPVVEAADDVRRLNIFLNDIELSPYLSVPVDSGRAASSVICNLFRHVGSGQAKDFISNLPNAFQGVIQCERESESAERFGRGELLDRVGKDLNISPDQSASVCRAVLQAIRYHIPAHQLDEIQSQLPPELMELFGPPTRRAA